MSDSVQSTGTKALGELVTLVAAGYQGFVEARSDGKIDVSDVVYLMPVFKAIGPVVSDFKDVIPEAKDLTDAEIQGLISQVTTAVPTLAAEGAAIAKVAACLSLLRAAKDTYLAFAGQ